MNREGRRRGEDGINSTRTYRNAERKEPGQLVDGEYETVFVVEAGRFFFVFITPLTVAVVVGAVAVEGLHPPDALWGFPSFVVLFHVGFGIAAPQRSVF